VARGGTHPSRSDDVGALTVYLSYLSKFFKPVKDLATTTNAIAQAAVGVDRIRSILDTDSIIAERDDAIEPRFIKGDIVSTTWLLAIPWMPKVLGDVSFHIKPGQFGGSGWTQLAAENPRSSA